MITVFLITKKGDVMDFNQIDMMQFMYQVIIVVLFVYCIKMIVRWLGMSDQSIFTWIAVGLVLLLTYQYFIDAPYVA